jgi:hypothetical protein
MSDAVGGGTALQAGRSRVPFPMGSLGFFIDLSLRSHYGPGNEPVSNRNDGVKASGALPP